MKQNFDKSLKILLKHEGGYVNHPKDPGGETNLGVTKRVYEDWGGSKNMKDLKKMLLLYIKTIIGIGVSAIIFLQA